jgi:hypothetical protein
MASKILHITGDGDEKGILWSYPWGGSRPFTHYTFVRTHDPLYGGIQPSNYLYESLWDGLPQRDLYAIEAAGQVRFDAVNINTWLYSTDLHHIYFCLKMPGYPVWESSVINAYYYEPWHYESRALAANPITGSAWKWQDLVSIQLGVKLELYYSFGQVGVEYMELELTNAHKIRRGLPQII